MGIHVGAPNDDIIDGGSTAVVVASDAKGRWPTAGNGVYICDGTADNVQIQAAIDDIIANSPTEGGTIILSEGNFIIAATIIVDGQLAIKGQGIQATILKLANSANVDMWGYNKSTNDFEFHLEYMTLHGNKANNTSGSGVNIDTGTGTLQDIHLNYVFPQLFAKSGFIISSGWGLVMENCIVELCDEVGVELLGANGRVVNCKIGSNSADGGFYNLWIRGQEFMVIGNQFFSSASNIGEGVRISGNRNVLVGNDIYNSLAQECIFVAGDDNIIDSNMIYDGSLDSAYGVKLNSQADGNRVTNNKFVGTFSVSAVEDLGTNNVIRHNTGWVTEKGGVATLVSGQTTIAVNHGLSDYPVGLSSITTGSGLDDTTSSGTHTGGTDDTYVVTIATSAAPDTFDWTVNGGGGANGVAITGSAQTLSNGVKITFAATTGHTVADAWTIVAPVTPEAKDFVVTPIESWGSATKFWVTTITSTQFTITVDQDPGQDVDFAWKAMIF